MILPDLNVYYLGWPLILYFPTFCMLLKLGSLVPAGPGGAAVGWPAGVDGSAAVIGVTRVPIAGPRPSTGPWPLAGLAKPTHFFRGVGSQCPSGMPELDGGGVTPSLVMPLLCASDTQRGQAKPGDAPMVCQRLTGGSCQARQCLSGGPALDRGLRQAWRCPSGGPALDIGVTPSPVMPLWWPSAQQGDAGHCPDGGEGR